MPEEMSDAPEINPEHPFTPPNVESNFDMASAAAHNQPNIPLSSNDGAAPEAPAITGTPGFDATSPLATAAAQPTKPAEPPLHSKIAEGIIHAFAGTDGSPMSALKSAIAGGLGGLAAAASQPSKPGDPIGSGLGAGFAGVQAQQRQQQQRQDVLHQQEIENQHQQAQLDLAKSREGREKTTGDRDYDLRLREDARQQATSIQQASAFEKRGTLLDQDIANGKFDSTKKQADYLQGQADQWNDFKSHGAKPLSVNGADSPEFDHLGDAEKFATENFDAAAHPDFKTRVVRDPDSGKWRIFEMPYEAPKWHEITDAQNKPQKIFTDTMGALAAQEQVAKTKHYLNVAAKSSQDLKRELEEYKEEGTVKGARKELTKVGGDYAALTPGSKSALLMDAQNQFTKVNTLLERIEQKQPELRTPEEVETLSQYGSVRTAYAKEISELTRPTFVPKPGANSPNGANATPNGAPAAKPAAPAPPRPANVPQGYNFNQNGPKGPGWYAPAASPAPSPAAAPVQQAAAEEPEDE